MRFQAIMLVLASGCAASSEQCQTPAECVEAAGGKADFFGVRVGVERWRTSLPAIGPVGDSEDVFPSTPALVGDEVYVGDHYHRSIYIADARSGRVLRRQATTTALAGGTSPVTVGGNRLAYAGTRAGALVVVSGGDEAWQLKLADGVPVAKPAVAADGTIFATTRDGKLHAVSSIGQLKWSFTLGGNEIVPPAVSPDGKLAVVVDGAPGTVLGVSSDGYVRWISQNGREYFATAAVFGQDGTVYIAGLANLYALDPVTGQKKWTVPHLCTEGPRSSPAVDPASGNVFVGCSNSLYGVEPRSGRVVFQHDDGAGAMFRTPVFAQNGVMMVARDNGSIYVRRPDARRFEYWEVFDEREVKAVSDPASPDDGSIYLNVITQANQNLLVAVQGY